jgi:hypothetical protein
MLSNSYNSQATCSSCCFLLLLLLLLQLLPTMDSQALCCCLWSLSRLHPQLNPTFIRALLDRCEQIYSSFNSEGLAILAHTLHNLQLNPLNRKWCEGFLLASLGVLPCCNSQNLGSLGLFVSSWGGGSVSGRLMVKWQQEWLYSCQLQFQSFTAQVRRAVEVSA